MLGERPPFELNAYAFPPQGMGSDGLLDWENVQRALAAGSSRKKEDPKTEEEFVAPKWTTLKHIFHNVLLIAAPIIDKFSLPNVDISQVEWKKLQHHLDKANKLAKDPTSLKFQQHDRMAQALFDNSSLFWIGSIKRRVGSVQLCYSPRYIIDQQNDIDEKRQEIINFKAIKRIPRT